MADRSSDQQQLILALAILIIVTGATYFLYTLSLKHAASPETYRPIPSELPLSASEIIDLRVYPVKSCRGFSVTSRQLLRSGLELDRQWMFVSWDKKKDGWMFMTIRGEAKMTLINTSVNEKTDELVLSVDDPAIRITVPAHPSKEYLEKETTEAPVEIWSKDTPARIYSASLTAELASFLGMEDVRLVYKGPYTQPRILRGNGAPQFLGRTESLGFADMMPVQVASQASMDELNSRLTDAKSIDSPFSIERFRPNIIVRGEKPWAEDSWKILRIVDPSAHSNSAHNDLKRAPTAPGPPFILDVASRCLRCQVPNVDPDSAEKHAKQPWDTMVKYRRIDEGLKFKPSFGMLCCPRNEGVIEVGMKLEVLEEVDDHYFRSPMVA